MNNATSPQAKPTQPAPDEPFDPEAGDGPPTLRFYRRVAYTDPATLIDPSHPQRQTDPYDTTAEV